MGGARSLALLLLATLLAAAGPVPDLPASPRTRAARASWEVSPSPPGVESVGVPLDALEGALDTPDALDAALGAEEAPAWRELWYASLEARRRQPVLNASREDVLAQLGATAFLHCPVRHLGERGISWVRRRDWHIISSGLFMYTNDERFQVLHSEGSDDWTLQIKFVQKRDNGTYECQVSTAQGPLSRLVALHVLVPEAFILGADEHHVDAGSTISLVCIIEKVHSGCRRQGAQSRLIVMHVLLSEAFIRLVDAGSTISLLCIIEKSPVPPQYVFWYHNERMINYDASRGVAVATAPGARTQSALTIRDAAPRHSGNYSCRAPNTEPAAIYVYVSEGSESTRQFLCLHFHVNYNFSFFFVVLLFFYELHNT
ncbi:igLON family member 5-like isoform X1 [Cydia pomonella]|uniref:igLON family member 5-like isoform X1 n=1 Tax=Cydia pomonella TaxID=82600 RepID=UPI002ADDC31A|nr:igLON family member 5-like isoform X1 [Cydia pomonella]XP_061720685.1 igLON family member 5-like isoform X1 [Cydia pomonella]XP_061720686.1 igLON family member 5-like isoform X1 [Cydia pomonella]